MDLESDRDTSNCSLCVTFNHSLRYPRFTVHLELFLVDRCVLAKLLVPRCSRLQLVDQVILCRRSLFTLLHAAIAFKYAPYRVARSGPKLNAGFRWIHRCILHFMYVLLRGAVGGCETIGKYLCSATAFASATWHWLSTSISRILFSKASARSKRSARSASCNYFAPEDEKCIVACVKIR